MSTEKPAATASASKTELVKEIKLPTAVLGLDLTSEADKAYAACFDGGIYEVETDSGDRRLLLKHDSYASGVLLLSRAQLLISSGYDGTLRWFDLAERNLIRQVQAHRFWSWKSALAADESLVASVTGQYRAGGYKYEPATEDEPSVKVFDTASGELVHSFSHVPPVLSVGFSPDARYLAAGNMMGEVRVWDLQSRSLAAQWTTPDFTSWGIIKSHHYIGGIYSIAFRPEGQDLFVCGMGPMTDPMAGNGKQTWQRFAWRESPPRKTAEINDAERGNGLMETLAFHPHGRTFLMAGRLAQGKWNTALFESDSGKLAHGLDTKMRVTSARFAGDGERIFLSGAVGQEKKKDGKYPEFGRVKIYRLLG